MQQCRLLGFLHLNIRSGPSSTFSEESHSVLQLFTLLPSTKHWLSPKTRCTRSSYHIRVVGRWLDVTLNINTCTRVIKNIINKLSIQSPRFGGNCLPTTKGIITPNRTRQFIVIHPKTLTRSRGYARCQ